MYILKLFSEVFIPSIDQAVSCYVLLCLLCFKLYLWHVQIGCTLSVPVHSSCCICASSVDSVVHAGLGCCWLLYVLASCLCISRICWVVCTAKLRSWRSSFLFQSQYADSGPTSPSTDPIMPGTWQDSHWSIHFQVTGMTWPGKRFTGKARMEPMSASLVVDTLPLGEWGGRSCGKIECI